MKMKIGIIWLFLMMTVCPLWSQCPRGNKAIKAGESLVYDLKFNWQFIWVDAGKAEMDVQDVTWNGEQAYRCNLTAVSNRKVDFFFKMRDTLTCVTTRQLEPLYFRKGAVEGKRYTVDEVKFSRTQGKCSVSQSRTRSGREPRYSEETSDGCIHDMLSILMQARSFDPAEYKVGDKILFDMATGVKVEEQTLIFRGKEIFKAADGTRYRCLVFSLVEYDDDKEKEVITFYVTDDKNHLPVRLDLYLNFGSAKAFLKTVKGNRHPMTSIVKG